MRAEEVEPAEEERPFEGPSAGEEFERRDRGGTDVSSRQPAGTHAERRAAGEWPSELEEVEEERDWSR